MHTLSTEQNVNLVFLKFLLKTIQGLRILLELFIDRGCITEFGILTIDALQPRQAISDNMKWC